MTKEPSDDDKALAPEENESKRPRKNPTNSSFSQSDSTIITELLQEEIQSQESGGSKKLFKGEKASDKSDLKKQCESCQEMSNLNNFSLKNYYAKWLKIYPNKLLFLRLCEFVCSGALE